MSTNMGNKVPSKVFVLSTPRSGSSLLRYILDTHPKVCCPGELNLGPVCEHLYWAAFYTLGQVGGSDEIDQMNIADAEVRRMVNSLMASYTRLKGKQVWCEKTPANLKHLETLKRIFPEAVYICLYRNCMDTAYSCIESSRLGFMDELWDYVRRHPGNLVAAMVESWIDQMKAMIKFERANKSKCFPIKYESLVLNPVETLQPLFSFLGLEWRDDLLENVFRSQHDAGPGDVKIEFARRIYTGSIGKGSALDRSAIPNEMLEGLNAVLTSLDYPEVGPDWNHSPSPYLPLAARKTAGRRVASIEEVFTLHIPQRLEEQAPPLDELSGVLKFVISGQDGCVWRIDMTRRPNEITSENGTADCVIKVSGSDLIKIVNGESNPGESFLQGKLHVAGDVKLGIAFGRIVFGA
jgi:protein-tyrosine sulfotransferase